MLASPSPHKRHPRPCASRSSRHRYASPDPSPRHHRCRTPRSEASPYPPRGPRQVVRPRPAGALPLGELSRRSGRAREAPPPPQLRETSRPLPLLPRRRRPGGSHAAECLGNAPAGRGSGPSPPVNPRSPPPLAPDRPLLSMGDWHPPGPTTTQPPGLWEGSGQKDGSRQRGGERRRVQGTHQREQGHRGQHITGATNDRGTTKSGQDQGQGPQR